MRTPAVYEVRLIDSVDKQVFIIDQCDSLPYAQPYPMSVTNDCEGVCQRLFKRFGNYRFFYKDTMGNWDELVHEQGRFRRFMPARSVAAQAGLT